MPIHKFLVVFVTAVQLLSPRVQSQVTFDQPCPKLDVVRDFDLHRYLGLWYEIESYPAVFSSFASCVTANYSLLADGNVRVINRSFNTSSKSFNMVDGTARLIEPPKGQAKLGVVFPSNSFSRPVPADGNYWVLDTDYTNYSIVWSCQTFNGKSIQFLWYLSRQRQPSESGLTFVHHRIDSFGLDQKFLKTTEQRNCPDAPTSETSRPIRQQPPTRTSYYYREN
ncbi:apolipoprotein D-like isoform X2 [Daphnia pulicaria]|uniref:apolipoprotein D-like isoform X2 n=1 Tax=Daphnia pulicaria TaxID=35523 RepID=UPI001EE9E0FB|nr:apolipoprotein D-like isoform X2 [Daphnia pulicaria]XP_046632633.1 apolipoprotein D-like isoform X2 [Daphnia pulicaria]